MVVYSFTLTRGSRLKRVYNDTDGFLFGRPARDGDCPFGTICPFGREWFTPCVKLERSTGMFAKTNWSAGSTCSESASQGIECLRVVLLLATVAIVPLVGGSRVAG